MAAYPAHCCGNDLAFCKLVARTIVDDPTGFVFLAIEHLRSIEAKGTYTNKDLASVRYGNKDLSELKGFWASRFVDDYCLYCRHIFERVYRIEKKMTFYRLVF